MQLKLYWIWQNSSLNTLDQSETAVSYADDKDLLSRLEL